MDQQHQHENKDNLLSAKSELNPSSMGPPPLDIKHQPQSPISQNSTYENHPPSSSGTNTVQSLYPGGIGGSNSDHGSDGYNPNQNSYSNIQTSSASAYSPPLHHHSHHQGHHPSLVPPLDSGVRGSASSTGGSDYSVNNSSPPLNHSSLTDPGLSNFGSSGHVGAIRNSPFNSSNSKGSKGKNRPNAGKYCVSFRECVIFM